MRNLPIFQAVIDGTEQGIFNVSLVEFPATESKFVCFKDNPEIQQFSVQSEEEHIVSGVIMLANSPIYRRDKDGFEYYIVYSPETIQVMAEKMLLDGTFNAIDLQHSFNLVEGVNLIELFIKSEQKGINPSYLENVPDGSLIANYKVHNEEIWKAIKSGELNGFSLSGLFELIGNETEEQELEDILNSLKKLRKIK